MKVTTKVSETLDKILTSFETGNIADAIAHTVLNRRNTDIPQSSWSFHNQLLCLIGGTSDARGYRQWEEVKRNVKKGSKALYILAPMVGKRKDAETDEDKTFVYGFRTIPVFGVESTDGEPVPVPEPLNPSDAPPLWDVAEYWQIPVSYLPFGGKYYGQYRFGYFGNSEQIVLCTHDESTFFHELAHAAHRRILGSLKGGQDWKQEIVAELSAAVLGRLFGKDTEGRSYQYVKGYAEKAKKDTHKACLAVLTDVKAVLDLILNTAETINSPDAIAAD